MDSAAPGTDTLSPVGDLLIQLRVAVAQFRLYPPHSPQVFKAVSAAFQIVGFHLAKRPAFTISASPRGLLVNGRRPRPGDAVADSVESALLSVLHEASVRTITFRKGMALEELTTFLAALTQKFWDMKNGKEINRRLRERRVTRIAVDEVDYVAVAQGDLLIRNAEEKLAASNTKLADVMKTVDGMMESTMSPGVASEARLRIMQKMLDQDPSLLGRLHTEALPRSGPEPEGRISFETARRALGELTQVMKGVEPGARESLQIVVELLLRSFRDRPELFESMREVVSDAASELLEDWRREVFDETPSEPGAVLRANDLLTGSGESRLEDLEDEVPALAGELAALGRCDLVQKLLVLPLEALGDRTSRRRIAACRTLKSLRLAYQSHAADETRALTENEVRAALIAEADSEVYSHLVDVITGLAEHRLLASSWVAATGLLDILHEHHQVKKSSQPWRSSMAYQALERIAGAEGLKSVATGLQEGDPEAVRVIEALGSAAAIFLVNLLKNSDSPALRTQSAQLLSRAGPEAAAAVAEEARRTESPTDAIRLMEGVTVAVPDATAEMILEGFLRHPITPVRRRAGVLLGERGYPHAGTILLDALGSDEESSVRAVLIEGLGKLRHAPAALTLGDLAQSRSESDEVRVAACLALGRLGDLKAVALLARLCQRGARGLTRVFTPTGPSVRAAAARALGQYPGSEEAREALQRARNDPDPAVRAAASESLYASLHGAFGELVREVQLVSAVQDLKTENWKLAGSFAEIPFDQVCQLVGGSAKSGVLMVNADGPVARIYFEAGSVVCAEFEGRVDQEVFNVLCRRRTGFFLFQPNEPPPRRGTRLPVTQMLLEAFRATDELTRDSA